MTPRTQLAIKSKTTNIKAILKIQKYTLLIAQMFESYFRKYYLLMTICNKYVIKYYLLY